MHAYFSRLMDRLGPIEENPVIAVALSGGSDSMALALLAHKWANQRGGKAIMLHVDHGIRPESSSEADTIVTRCEALGMECHILRWYHHDIDHALQESARNARYDLMSRWCQHKGVLHLLMAHHADDQIETFFFRLSRGSGLAGMRSMPAVRIHNDVQILRPLLTTYKSELVKWLEQQHIHWIEDRSNDTNAYTRNRFRLAFKKQERYEVLSAHSVDLCHDFIRMQSQIERKTVIQLTHTVQLHPAGFAYVDCRLLDAPEVTACDALQRIIYALRGTHTPVRGSHMKQLYKTLLLQKPATLAGLHFIVKPAREQILITHEHDAHVCIGAGNHAIWRDNMHVSYHGHHKHVDIRCLGSKGLKLLKQAGQPYISLWDDAAIRNMASFWHLEELLAVPHMGYKADDGTYCARILDVKPLADAPFLGMNILRLNDQQEYSARAQ